MALLYLVLLYVLLLNDSAAENQRNVSDNGRKLPAKNDDVRAFFPGKNDDVRAFFPAKNDDVRAFSPAKNDDVRAFSPVKNDDVRAFSPMKNDDVRAFSPAKIDDVRAFSPAKNDDVRAFSAELSQDAEIAPDGTIVFDRTLTNAGGLYYDSSGQFACLDDGLYVFVWNFLNFGTSEFPGMRCIGSLRSASSDLKYGPKTNLYGTYDGGVTEMTAIHQCSSNSPTAVTVAVRPWSEDAGSNSVFYRSFTSFSGFKLNSTIAFTTELSQDQLKFPGDRILFDKVLANHGDQYDGIHGYFRCPDAGLYVFSLSIQSYGIAGLPYVWSVARLMLDKEVVIKGPINFAATPSDDSGSASTTVVLECIPGLSVYVESQSAHDFLYTSYGAELTSFTGFKLYDVNPEAIAFTVVLSQNFTSTADNVPIPYDAIITNIGNAFDTSANRFVCPDDAYYLFTWTVVTTPGYSHVDLYVNSARVKVNYSTLQSSGTSGSSTQTVILQCQPGSVVQIVSENADRNFLGGYNSFSGYKLPG